ncbi:hypothetical protein GCM10022246_06980 [Pedobacter ginsengiterrae]|uniref:Uncharacterized protein n=1 Tax=Pedobacter ginsengiterrae TaxID=871696 RepID=A0ABP7NZ04_9SPHI
MKEVHIKKNKSSDGSALKPLYNLLHTKNMIALNVELRLMNPELYFRIHRRKRSIIHLLNNSF